MGKAIVISGTPGVGKSSVAKELARILGAKYLNLSDFVIKEKLYLGYDDKVNSYIIDEELVRRRINEYIESLRGLVIIDSHYGEIINDKLVEKIFVLRLNPNELLRRLKGKGWSDEKIRENVEAELLGICTYNALQEHPKDKVCEIDVTNKDISDVIKLILRILKGDGECKTFIDWLSDANIGEILEYVSRREYINE